MRDKNFKFWDSFNKDRFDLGVQKLLKNSFFLDTQIYPYDQINELRSLSIILIQIFKKKINILDYGGSFISFSGLFKLNQKHYRAKNFYKNAECDIFNPHTDFLFKKKYTSIKKKISKETPIKFIKKINKNKKYDLLLFGSVLQYVSNLEILKYLFMHKPKFILITQTPISVDKRTYEHFQINQKVPQLIYIHSINKILIDLLESKYEIVYISSIDQKLCGLKKKDYVNKVEYINILLKYKN